MKKLLFSLLAGMGLPLLVLAQMGLAAASENNEENEGVFLRKTSEKIIIDGDPSEAAWYSGRGASNFWENFPTDSVRCSARTEVYLTYDDDNLYIAARCYAPGNDYVIPSLRRDFRAGGSDNLTFLLDPFCDRTNAFVFGMNPAGVMREALISNGGNSGSDWLGEWDNRWRGESKIFDDHWSCEIAIPFSTLRYPKDKTLWYFNSYRFDTQSNTRSSWQRIPQQQIIMSLAFLGNMYWETPPPEPGKTFTVIPYLAGSSQRDFESSAPRQTLFNAGADAKIALTTGLNLDLTTNPDFSQAEVDQQVINLSRFELFFPERRQFFLENADLFGAFGDDRANPFFTRRIGITRDTSTGTALANPIYYGARLSGKLDQNWRLGLLNMQTAANQDNGLPSYMYTVAAVQRKLFARSNVGMIVVNKDALSDILSDSVYSQFNRVIGLDYNLASADNRWTGKAYLHRSFSRDEGHNPYSHGLRLDYRVRPFSVGVEHRYVDEDFKAEVGFVPRRGYRQVNLRGQLFYYPKHSSLNQHGPGIRSRFIWTPEDGSTDRIAHLFWDFRFLNTSQLSINVRQSYTYLFDEFDPSGTASIPLPAGSDYTYTEYSIEYSSDRRRPFSVRLEPTAGTYFNGRRYGIRSGLTWRYQPYGQITLTTNYNYIDLPEPFTSTSLFLIGPRIDLTLSRVVFLTTFFQYNDQLDNVNINARLQWRFAPVSDFFLVYTENYNPLDWQVKNRSLVAKLTYWLNT
ncbi:MAG: hypothetical protein D6772_01045 [Bacteroidetes bacterium]|nr:MAG: hypothetical protein D6772_01045 [Bacteroidota bacterium]